MAYPIKLTKPEGIRRFDLLKQIHASTTIVMSDMGTEEAKKDLRWLWSKGLLQVKHCRPDKGLVYEMDEAGRFAIENEDAELQRLADKLTKESTSR